MTNAWKDETVVLVLATVKRQKARENICRRPGDSLESDMNRSDWTTIASLNSKIAEDPMFVCALCGTSER